jgi:hypothetical protein
LLGRIRNLRDAARQSRCDAGEYFRFGANYNNAIFWSNPNAWMNQDDDA